MTILNHSHMIFFVEIMYSAAGNNEMFQYKS